jgi:hypothetical protein
VCGILTKNCTGLFPLPCIIVFSHGRLCRRNLVYIELVWSKKMTRRSLKIIDKQFYQATINVICKSMVMGTNSVVVNVVGSMWLVGG